MHFLVLVPAMLVVANALAQDGQPGPGRCFVATNGSDAWSGKLVEPNAAKTDGPFATLERARDEVRKLKAAGPLPKGGVVVEMRGGVYELGRPFELTTADSGAADAPIVYQARRGEEVRLVGGKVVTGWKPVTDPAALARLDESARGKALQADLRAQGIADLGEMKPGPRWNLSEAGLELFFKDQPMTLARWPNEGFVKIVEVLGETPIDVRGTKGCREGVFSYDGDRPKRWAGEKDIMLHGYWFRDWADQRHKVETIDTEKRVIRVAKPYHDFGYRKGMYYYAYNLLSELDRPGEWYLDRQSGILYFWPPAAIESGKAMVSLLPTLVTMKDVSHVTLRGMTLEGCRGTAVIVSGGSHTRVAGCVIRNCGSWAARISGTDNGVVGCDIYQTGDGGIGLSGGDRKTLTAAKLYAENNHIHHYSRWNPILKSGVQVEGVGNRVAHNLIHNAPHKAIVFGGNEHVIEFNEIHSVVYQANDAGVMYAGYNPTTRGHQIRYNYLHHVYGYQGKGCVGVYLDDMFCSATIFGNVFYEVPRAAFIGGGRDNLVENNIFVNCTPAVHVDARALGWASAGVENLRKRLLEMPYQQEPWRTRYPQLLTYLDDEPAVPKGNVIARNVCWGGKWDEIEAKARPHVTFVDNLLDADPLFVGAVGEAQKSGLSEKPDFLRAFELRDDSPAWKLGFKRIPVEKIGLYPDELRASWPVQHAVRPKETPPGAGPRPVFKVGRAAATVMVDGTISPSEWAGADPAKAMPLEQ
ncbi:MAG: right-handed parallel beta-helix repeat-containing protein, partial [Planctomycetes bacterium]|nr:right-handed parallel beta-helix repeat-containing protein [Planctomycetota bacterium]